MNVQPNFTRAERHDLESKLKVDYILEDARQQALAVAESMNAIDTVSDEYRFSSNTPDLASTIRIAESLGATVEIVVTRVPE